MEPIHPLRAGWLFKLSLMKYDAKDEGRPAAERMLSMSCMDSKKIIWPLERCRTSLERSGRYL